VTGVPFTLNGQELEANDGELLIDAAERHGIHIPRFCHHSRMKPVGMCRMCLVEVDSGRGPGLQPSCMVPVSPQMKVETDSEATVAAQDGVLELLLANHPLDCPVCDKGGECPLQDNAYAFGPGESQFVEEKRHYEKPIPISDLVHLDRERCILCDRCTRFADEVAGDPLIHFIGRGASTQVNTFPDHPFSSYFSGNTVQICPVGALTAAPYRFKARPWDLTSVESTSTVDSVGSRVVVESSRDEIVRILGVDSDAVNWGWLSDKDRFSYEALNSTHRITTPLVRDSEGKLEPARWNDAVGSVADAISSSEPDRVAVIGGARSSLEGQYAWAKLVKGIIGSDSFDCQIGDGLPAPMVLGLPRATIADTCRPGGVMVLMGPDPKEITPALYLRLRHAVVNDGVDLIEISPRPTSLNHLAKHAIHPAPGNIGAVMAAIGKTHRSDSDVGVDADELDAIRELISADRPVSVVIGRSNVAESPRYTVDAIGALSRLNPNATFLPMLRRGNVLGGLEMGLSPSFLPGGIRRSGTSIDGWDNIADGDGRDTAGILKAAVAGDIDTIVLLGADPLADFPRRGLVEDALGRVPTVVAVDAFPTTTVSSYADIVLPAALVGEYDGTFMNMEGRLSPLRAKVTPAGQSRSDWQIAVALGNAMGGSCGFSTLAEVRSEMSKNAPSLAEVDWDEVDNSDDGVLADLTRNWVLEFGDPVPPPSSSSSGLRLIADHKLWDNGTMVTYSASLAGLVEPAVLRISITDAHELGLSDADRIKIDRDRSTLEVPIAIDPSHPAGVASMAIGGTGFDVRDLIAADRTVINLRIQPGGAA